MCRRWFCPMPFLPCLLEQKGGLLSSEWWVHSRVLYRNSIKSISSLISIEIGKDIIAGNLSQTSFQRFSSQCADASFHEKISKLLFILIEMKRKLLMRLFFHFGWICLKGLLEKKKLASAAPTVSVSMNSMCCIFYSTGKRKGR